MRRVTLDEAKTHLDELFEAAISGEEVFVTTNEGVSIQLVPRVVHKRKRQFGSANGAIIMAPDFDEPLEDFKEYM